MQADLGSRVLRWLVQALHGLADVLMRHLETRESRQSLKAIQQSVPDAQDHSCEDGPDGADRKIVDRWQRAHTGGPPAHWVEIVRRHAPSLLRAVRYGFDRTIRHEDHLSAVEQRSRDPRDSAENVTGPIPRAERTAVVSEPFCGSRFSRSEARTDSAPQPRIEQPVEVANSKIDSLAERCVDRSNHTGENDPVAAMSSDSPVSEQWPRARSAQTTQNSSRHPTDGVLRLKIPKDPRQVHATNEGKGKNKGLRSPFKVARSLNQSPESRSTTTREEGTGKDVLGGSTSPPVLHENPTSSHRETDDIRAFHSQDSTRTVHSRDPRVEASTRSAPDTRLPAPRNGLHAIGIDVIDPTIRFPGNSQAYEAARLGELLRPKLGFPEEQNRISQATTDRASNDVEQQSPATEEVIWPSLPDEHASDPEAIVSHWPRLPTESWSEEPGRHADSSSSVMAAERKVAERLKRLTREQQGISWSG